MKGLLRIQVLNFAKTKVVFVPLKNARWMSKRVPHAESKLHQPVVKLDAFLSSATFTKQYKVHIQKGETVLLEETINRYHFQ